MMARNFPADFDQIASPAADDKLMLFDDTGAVVGYAEVGDLPGGPGGGGAVDSVNGQTGVVVLDAADVGAATSAQGALADTAVQPGDLATVATTGAYADLIGEPTLATVATTGAYADLSGKPTLGTAAAAATTDFATAAQGALADSAVQPAALAGYQPVDSDLTAIAALATTAYGRAFLALADQAALMALVAAGNEASAGKLELATNAETVTGTDTARATHAAGVKAAIDAAIAGVLDSAPAALDTLNELAAALGDDANFASTVTTALAGKQPLDADLTALAAAGNSATLAATTAAFTTADETKLDGIEALADVTDAANVAAAGALMKVAGGAAVENLGAVEFNVNVVAATGAAETLDTSVYGVHDCTMDQACEFTFSNPAPAGKLTEFVLILRGAFTPTLPASVDWPGAAPTYTTPSMYVFSTVDAGTTWLGRQVGAAFS